MKIRKMRLTMTTNRGLWAVIKRYQTLMLFGILVGSSSVFVACGSDDDATPPPAGGKAGRGGTGGTAGRGGTGGDAPSTNDSATSSLEDEEVE